MHQMGLPLTQALAHDLSKYRPSEFGPYSEWFNGPKGLKGAHDDETHKKWRKAVELHYSRNPHHWRKQGLTPEQVPMKYKEESVADWYSVGKTNRPKHTDYPTFKQWYTQRQEKLPIDKATKNEISTQLGLKGKFLHKAKKQRDLTDRVLDVAIAQTNKGIPGIVKEVVTNASA